MIGSSRRPIVRVVGQAAQTHGYTAICGTQGCTWRSGPHVVKAAATEQARWHRDQHRRAPSAAATVLCDECGTHTTDPETCPHGREHCPECRENGYACNTCRGEHDPRWNR